MISAPEAGLGAGTRHILIIASFAQSLVNFRGPLIRDLLEAGFKITTTAPNIGPDVRLVLQAMGAEVVETPLVRTGSNPLADLSYFRSLLTLISGTKPDLVLTYTIKPNIWGAFAARRHGVASAAMVTGLGYAFTDAKGLRRTLIRRMAALLYRLATGWNRRVIFQNPDDLADFIAAGCLADPSKARMVNGSGVDTGHYDVVPLPDAPVFLMISRLLRNKGVAEYCEAATFLKAALPSARFLLVGYFDEGPDGVSRAEVDRWMAGGVEYLGPAGDVRPAIASASVYVLPSYREGTPRSVLEAMSMGRPIITTDAPGCRETVIEGENGFLVPVKDVAAVERAMRALAGNSELRTQMGRKSRQMALAKYDVKAVNRTLMQHLGLE